jgi:IS605 OrfB family transposase
VDRTIRIPLDPTPEQADALRETSRQFTDSFNRVCAEGWKRQDGNAFNLHRFAYRDCKDALPALVSDLHVQARQKAAEAVKSAMTKAKQGRKTGCPHSDLCPPRYNVHTFKVDWQKGVVNLATVQGRMKVRFTLPAYAVRFTGAKLCTADLVYRKKRFTLHVVIGLPDVPFTPNGLAVGVDLGVTRPAVTSDGRMHGKRHWRQVEKRTFRLRRALQSNGSRSAKRHLGNLAGRSARFRRDCEHVLSKRILSGVEAGTVIVVENLTNIRTRVKASRGEAKRRLDAWSFAQLKGLLEYKAEEIGCQVVGIDPRHTSRRCSACGHIYRGNRPSQSRFVCRSCGHRANADKNASENIRDKHLVGWSSPSGGSPSTGLSSQLASAVSAGE